MNKYIFILLILLPSLVLLFVISFTTPTYAQLSGCGEIDVGNPANNQQIPSQCNGGSLSKVPLYKQWDTRWASDTYGLSSCPTTIQAAGCGPTSMAMVISYLTGKQVLPPATANEVKENGWYVCGAGTAYEALLEVPAKYYNLKSKEITWSQDKTYLAKGIPVIQSHGPGYFTGGGHYIVVTGINKNGTYAINDPDGYHRTSATESEITSSLMASWVFSK
jgi:Peptidase_C39 like family